MEINVGIDGDEKTKKKLSAMDKFTEKSEKRMRQLDKIEASPAVKLQDKLSSPLKKMEGKIGSFAKTAIKRFTAIAAAGAILVGGFGLKDTMTTFMDFEQGMQNVQAVSMATAEEMSQLTDEAKRLGRETEWSAVQVAEAEQLLAQAGFSIKENIAALPGLLNLASAGGIDLANATDIAAGTIRAFGLEAEQAAHVADVLAVASSSTNSDVMGLGESMKYVGPAAKALGIDVEQTTAMLGMLANANIKGSQAGTTMRAALVRLAKPTKQSSAMMKQLGLNAFDSTGKMLPMHELVGNLEKSTSGLTEQQKANAIATIFGQEAMSGMLALIEQGPDALKDLTQSLYDSEGAAQNMADIRLDSLSGQMKILKSATEGMKIELGEQLAPYAKEFVNWFTPKIPIITDKIMELIGKMKEFGTKAYPAVLKFIDGIKAIFPLIAGIGAAFAVLKIASTIGTIIKVVSTIGAVVGKVVFAFQAVAGGAATIGQAMAFLMGPVGWVALAIGALVTGFILAYKNSETFRNKVNDLKSSFVEFITPIVDAVLPILQKMGMAFMNLASAVIPFISSGIKLLMGILTVLWVNVLQPLAVFIGEVFSSTIQTAFSVIGSIITNVIETITGVLNGLSLILGGIADFIVGVFTGNWEQAWEGIKGITEGVIVVIKSIFTGLIDFVKDIPGQMLEIGKNIMQGLANGIKTAVSIPVNAIKNVGKSIAGGIKGALKIKSPSRVMMEYGEFTTEGLAKGMEDRMPLLEAVVGTTYKVMTSEQSKADKISGKGSTLMEKVVERVKEIKPFNPKSDPDDGGGKKRVALAGAGGQVVYYNVNIDNIDVSTGGVSENTSDQDLKEMVDEAQTEFARKLLEALKDKK